ncbi:RDD family protein [Corynebacterium sp. A21]|uniref:RDD family protein n=1 Tax=Corynebacterium sp. A21 TaxID=3457318 RepID=UPI003FD62D78
MANQKRSWIEGPQIPAENDDPLAPGQWPGEKLGFPEKGERSLAPVMRRLGGVFIDWIIAWIIANFIHMFTDWFGDVATMTLGIFVIIGVVSVWLLARTPGQAVLGMGVARIDIPGARVGFIRALLRTVLTAFLLPAVLVDADGRGMHDRGTGTAVIRG